MDALEKTNSMGKFEHDTLIVDMGSMTFASSGNIALVNMLDGGWEILERTVVGDRFIHFILRKAV